MTTDCLLINGFSPFLACWDHKIVLHWYDKQNKNNFVIMCCKSWWIVRSTQTISWWLTYRNCNFLIKNIWIRGLLKRLWSYLRCTLNSPIKLIISIDIILPWTHLTPECGGDCKGSRKEPNQGDVNGVRPWAEMKEWIKDLENTSNNYKEIWPFSVTSRRPQKDSKRLQKDPKKTSKDLQKTSKRTYRGTTPSSPAKFHLQFSTKRW